MVVILFLFVDKKGDGIEFNEDDILGVKLLKLVEYCIVLVLKWWLLCRGVKVSGKRKDFVVR